MPVWKYHKLLFALTMLALFAVAGCGAPEPKRFADSEGVEDLHPEAARIARQDVDSHFGTPQNLVASMQFADDKGNTVIDYGRIEGVVTADGAANDFQLKVKLTGDPSLKPEDLQGLGLIWTSGAYQQAVEVPKKKGEAATTPAFFRATRFEPGEQGTGVLSLNYKLEKAPSANDKFVLIGHRLRTGRGLYMQHCMHCHGYSGDGNGPTAKYLNPRPRDYRKGLFKFTSTHAKEKASREDLYDIVRQGIPGTYMPSFLLLEEKELEDIIEYVRFLAIRGEYENAVAVALGADFSRQAWERLQSTAEQRYNETIKALKEGGVAQSEFPTRESFNPKQQLDKFVAGPFAADESVRINRIAGNWARASKDVALLRPQVPRTPATRASIQRGRSLFLSKKTNCFECHGYTGRGDGSQTTTYLSKQFGDKKGLNPEPGLYDEWGNKIQPRNFHTGIFRGGRRPLDIYRRIKAGIKGTPMQAFGALKDEEVWDLVNYVLAVQHLENGTFEPEQPSSKPTAKQTAAK